MKKIQKSIYSEVKIIIGIVSFLIFSNTYAYLPPQIDYSSEIKLTPNNVCIKASIYKDDYSESYTLGIFSRCKDIYIYIYIRRRWSNISR